MSDVDYQYTHICEDFPKNVDEHFKTLDILSYFPYGDKTEWEHFLTGKVDLRDWHKHDMYDGVDAKAIAHDIRKEVAYAMNYTTYHMPNDWFDRQRLESYCLYRLFSIGMRGWNKDLITPDMLDDDIAFLEDYHFYRHVAITGREERGNYHQRMYKRKEFGIYEVKTMPLLSSDRFNPKALYNKQKMAAIHLMVMCAFENMC